MRIFVTLWLTLLAFFGRELLAPQIKQAKPEKKRNQPIPPLREDWFTDPALGREMKREFCR